MTEFAKQPRKLEASTLEQALDEARQMADLEIGTVDVHMVMAGEAMHMRTVRASKQAVAEYKAWRAARAA